MKEPISVVLKFKELINSRDAEAVCALLTPDSMFVDSMGNRVNGRDRLRESWKGYFEIVPDYTISHFCIVANGDVVGMFGHAQGTFSKDGTLCHEDFWKTPTAWRVVVNDGLIARWEVFADNEPIRSVMRRHR